MRRVPLLPILPFALLFACGVRHATPSLSMDFQPGGVPLDVAGPDADDVPGTREDVPPAEDRLVPPDEGQEAVGDDVPVGTDVPVGDHVPPAGRIYSRLSTATFPVPIPTRRDRDAPLSS